MSTIHASVSMASAPGAMMVGGNLSALGKALGETSISSPDPASPSSLSMAPPAAAAAPKKSPKKRERTDSMKKMTPLPAAQRAKSQGAAYDSTGHDDDGLGGDDDEEDDDDDDALGEDEDEDDGEGDDGYSDASSSAADASGIKLPVKDRTGSAIAGVSRVTLISNAVKTAPPAKEKSNPRRWSKAEDESLRLAVERSGERNWKAIAEQVPGRNHTQCLQRWTKVLKPGLIKGHWDPEEDAKLRDLVAEGKRNWGQVASLIPGRTSKQCRERWCNHLDPNINKGLYTEDEDRIIMEMQAKLGNRWSIIAQHLKGRTEDAVKIRWKSLMRGKKAAGKELQQQHQQQQSQSVGTTSTSAELMASASFPPAVSTVPTITTNATPQTEDRSRAKPARTPTKQKTRAASPVAKPLEPIAFKPEPTSNMAPAMQQQQQQQQQQHPPPQPIHLPPSSAGVGLDASGGNSIDSNQVAASINSYMQNVNDMVAQSIHNFRLSQNFSPGMQVGPPVSGSSGPQTSAAPAVTSAHMMGSNHPSMMSQSTISPMNQPVYSMPPQQGYHGMPQQHRPYAVPTSYHMQASMNLPPNYVLPNSGMGASAPGQHFPVTMQQSSAPMAMAMGGYGQYSAAMMNDGRGMPIQSQGQGYPASMGGSVGVTYQNGMPMVSQQYAMPQGLTIPPTHPPVAGSQPEPLAPVSAPPVSLSTASKLATPREEWGSSQTPRSHLIMTEGHASAYELFHQQRLRLMLKERDKGMSLTSAPSPGQAMLTKELKANKERQKRQEMMQQGWKSAVDAMMSLTSDSPSLEDSDNLMEKVVGLSALDPVDDELMGGDVEISLPSDDTIVETDEPILITDNE